MAISILHFRHNNANQWGVLQGDYIVPLQQRCTTTAEFIQTYSISAIRSELNSGAARTLTLSEVTVLSPVTRNQQFLCQGANYRQHMIESGMDPDPKRFNMFFTKASSCIVPADSPLEKPDFVQFLDYEVELGLVLRQDIAHAIAVNEANLKQYVAGLVIVNDYSARDIQIPQMQFYKGKSYRTFGPVGPYLCLLDDDDYALIRQLNLTLTVNGEVRQQDSTANLVFGPEETLTEWSGVHDLYAGDLIATGTPAGCALAIPSPGKQRVGALLPEALKWKVFMKVQAQRSQYLKHGDVVVSAIRSACGTLNLGEQRNVVVPAKTRA